MLIKQQPNNKTQYIKVDGKLNTELQKRGYIPVFCDSGYFYYYKSMEIIKLLNVLYYIF